MEQKKIYLETLASRMRSAGQDNWAFNDMQDICELADLWSDWLNAKSRHENELVALKAAKKLGVEIRHYITLEKQGEASACSGCLKCESYRTSFENDFDDVHVEYGYCSLWLHSIVTTTEKKDRKVPIVLYEEFQQGFMNIVQQKAVEKMQTL